MCEVEREPARFLTTGAIAAIEKKNAMPVCLHFFRPQFAVLPGDEAKEGYTRLKQGTTGALSKIVGYLIFCAGCEGWSGGCGEGTRAGYVRFINPRAAEGGPQGVD